MTETKVTITPMQHQGAADPPHTPTIHPAALAAAACLFTGPLVLAAGLALYRFDLWTDQGTPNFGVLADARDQVRLSTELGMLGAALMIGAVLALATVASRRLPRAATVGAFLGILGLVAMAYQAAFDLPLLAMEGFGSSPEVTTVAERYAELAPAFSWAYALYPLGIIILAVALDRSHLIPRWAAIALGIGGLFPVAAATGIGPLAIPFAATFIAGAVPVAHVLRRLTPRPESQDRLTGRLGEDAVQ